MKSKMRQAINLIFFIFITNTQFLQAHNSLNGGCKNHCKESVTPITKVKELDNINAVSYTHLTLPTIYSV